MTKHVQRLMPRFISLLITAVGLTVVPTAHAVYTFGDWAAAQGYTPGDAMPDSVSAKSSSISHLDGIPDYNWTDTPTTLLSLYRNRISDISAVAGLTNLNRLNLFNNQIETLDLSSSDLSSLDHFSIEGNPVTNVLLNDAVLDQRLLSKLLDGGTSVDAGIGEIPGITNLDLSGVDFGDITDLSPLRMMDDLTDLWLVGASNIDAGRLDTLLDNLDTIEGTATEGVLHLSQADYDSLDAAGGGLLAA